MKDPETKALLAWTVWMFALSGVSAVSYRYWPRPGPPSIEVVVDRPAFNGEDPLVVTFVRKGGAGSVAMPIRYKIEGAARLLEDYRVEEPRGGLAIEPFKTEARLTLHRSPDPVPRPGAEVRDERRQLVIQVLDGDDYVANLDHGSAKTELTVKIVSPPQDPPRLTVSSKFKVFDEEHPDIPVEFHLDRRLNYRLAVPFKLDGEAQSSVDYRVIPAMGQPLVFEPGEQSKVVTVSKIDGADRGKGNRDVLVKFVPGESVLVGDASQVKLTIPDAVPRLSWKLSTDSVSLVEDVLVTISITLSKPKNEQVDVRYRIVADPSLKFEPPAGYQGSGVFSLPRNSSKNGQVKEFNLNLKGDDRVGGRPRTIQIECLDVTPAEVAPEKDRPEPLNLTIADDRDLAGKGLVLVVLTEDLLRDGVEVLGELKEMRDPEIAGRDLVGKAIYLLTAETPLAIRRFDPAKGIPKDARAFPDATPFESILGAAYKQVAAQFGPRVKDRDRSVFLVWRDSTDRGSDAFAEKDYKTPPKDYRWQLLFVGEKGTLADLLANRFPPDDKGAWTFHPIQMPISRRALCNTVVRLLRISAP